jgi:hypothetical protein
MDRYRHLVLTVILACAACAACPALAQAPGRILLGGDPNVPPAAQQRLGEILGRLATVVPSSAPPQPGDVAVIAELTAGSSGAPLLHITYYDGVSAAPLLTDEMPLDGGTIGPAYDSYLATRVQNAFAMVAQHGSGGAPPPPMAAPEMSAPEAGAPAASEAPPSEEGRPVAVSLGVGIGAGMHQAAFPTDVGNHTLPLATFPALDLMLQVDGVSHAGNVTPGLRVSYRTSIGYTLRETPPAGVEVSSPARTHEFEIDAVANLNFGDSRTALSLPIAVGWALDNSRTDVELTWPRYTLGGPRARVSLRIPISDGDVVLTLGPDVGGIVQVSGSLQRAGISATGMAFGGEAQLAVKVSERFALRALFREAHTVLSSARVAAKFSDVQRFMTVGAAIVY